MRQSANCLPSREPIAPQCRTVTRRRPDSEGQAKGQDRSARGEPPLPRPSRSGDRQNAVWIILAVILAAGIAAALIALVPRLRRLVSRRVRPHLLNIWANAKMIATEPRKLVYVLAGSTLAQLLVILALGASLHAVGAAR